MFRVRALVIRFYEAEGLLAPRRNSENGYRDYGDAEVQVLLQIKLLRKLGVPLPPLITRGTRAMIASMKAGGASLALRAVSQRISPAMPPIKSSISTVMV